MISQRGALKEILSGSSAGICIVIGCAVFLSLPEIKYLGAALFSVALLVICCKGYNLYTGRIGLIPENHSLKDISSLLLGLLGNVVSVVLFSWILRVGSPHLIDIAFAACKARLDILPIQAFIRGLFCGMLMYLAVSIYREAKTSAAILVCIPAFILSGFEHSIADICYFTVGGIMSWQALLFILTVFIGNTIGAIVLPTLKLLTTQKERL